MKSLLSIFIMFMCFCPITISRDSVYQDDWRLIVEDCENRLDDISKEFYKDSLSRLQIAIWIIEQQHYNYPENNGVKQRSNKGGG